MPEKKKILIIDDEEDIGYFSKAVLEKTGRFAASFTTKPVEGIELVKSWKPDLVLLDVFMPDMDGGTVAEILSKDDATKDIPIIFLTALARKSEVEEKTGKIGRHYFIAKPATSTELIKRIEAVLKAR